VRAGAIAAALVLVLFAATYLAARAYLPALVADRARLEARLAERIGHPVRLGRVVFDWEGLYPRLRAHEVALLDGDGAAAVRVDEVHMRLDPLALLRARVALARLVLIRPRLTLVRAPDGSIAVAGLAQSGEGPPGTHLAGLLGLPRVEVRDGVLRWRDAREPEGDLTLTGVALRLRAGAQHLRVALSAEFPPDLCGRCALSAELRGRAEGDWQGEVELDVDSLALARLPLALRERLPLGLAGGLDAQLIARWGDGRLRALRGTVDATGVTLRLPASEPIAIARVAGDVDWQAGAGGWALDASNLLLGVAGAPWHAGRLRLEHEPERTRLALEHLVLDELGVVAAAAQTRHPWLAQLAAREPRGMLHAIEAEIVGASAAPRDYRLEARLDNVGLRAHGRLPGVRGVSGWLRVDGQGGSLALDGTDFALDLPTVFRAPLEAARVHGRFSWRRTETGWLVSGDELAVQAADGSASGRLALELPHDRARSPVLDLRVDFRDGVGAHARRYYPVHKLPPRVLAWMESAFLGGRIVAGELLYQGPIRAFPFERGEGRFALQAEVRDGVYRYLPGWAPLTDVEARVTIEGADARITGRGRIGALDARDVEVTVGRAGSSGRAVRVHGTIEGPVAETIRVLRAVDTERAPAWRPALARVARASGQGRLALRAHVPLGGGARTFVADYRFEQATVTLASGPVIDRAAGSLRLNQAGLQEGRLEARAYGGSFRADVRRTDEGLLLQAEGDARAEALLRDRGPLAQRLNGPLAWNLSWREAAGGPRVRFESDLSAVQARLPAPFGPDDAGLPRRLTLTTAQSDARRLTLVLGGGPGLSGRLLLARDAGGWSVVKGRVDIGRPPGALPAGDGLELGIDVAELDLDQWLPLLQVRRASSAGGSGGALRVGVNAQIGRLVLLGRDWGRVFLNVARRGGEWRAVIDGTAAAGEALLLPGEGATPLRVRLDLAYLRLPDRIEGGTIAREAPDPRALPRIDLEVRSLEHDQRRLGELVLRAGPYARGWRIERLSLARPETALSAAGSWERERQRDVTRISFELESENLGETLDAWGIREQVRNGHVKLHGNLVWPGTPARPALEGLGGRVELSAENGRFLRLDPGAARLFGILDLRAIARYLTLDFSPALAKGLVFDAIHSSVAIDRGDASTDAFILSGPSLRLHAAGRVGLAREDLDLRLEVSPRVGDTLTLTSWGLFGPQAAAAVLAFKQLFRRQFQESTRITYAVTGSWENPEVRRLSKPVPGARSPEPTP
jgi:uncharacterized protein (TIGR02099 family)